MTESFVLTSLSHQKIVCNYTHVLLIHLFLPHGFVQFPLKISVMPSVTLEQNLLSLSVPSLLSLAHSLSIFMGLLVGVLEALPPLYFPVCGGSEKAKEKETARKREKKRIKEDRDDDDDLKGGQEHREHADGLLDVQSDSTPRA